ncbi:hypothetical protein RvY_07694 [Ramazzottius varieornatus]|uniref:Secreted protein n=1 Tax=Ramazzottius varieornatus TaxID=947166 RepID=A0A1D1VCK0_RAMVA|nr:hypothetical protein RvY_07694 [Ramazzottius varieornatus]
MGHSTKWEIGMLWPLWLWHSFLSQTGLPMCSPRENVRRKEPFPRCYVWNVLQSHVSCIREVCVLIILPVCPGRCIVKDNINIPSFVIVVDASLVAQKMLIQHDVLTDCGSFIE